MVRKNGSIWLGLMMLILIFIWAPVSHSQEKPITLKLGTIDAVANPANVATLKFSELVGQKTNGKVKIEVYPASQLGTAISQVESIMTGSLDMGQYVQNFYAQYMKDWNIISLAFVFRNQDHMRKYLASDLNKQVKEQFIKQFKVRLLSENWLRPPNVICTTKPVKGLDDLKNFQMRVPEIEMYLQNWKAMGCKPMVVSWGEVYMALRQGVVEGVDLPFDFITGMKFHEVAPYITMTNHLLTNATVVINEEVYQKLSPDVKKALAEAAQEAGDYYFQMGAKTVDTDREELLKKRNVKIYDVDMAPFRARSFALAKELEAKGYWKPGLYEAIQAIK